MGGESQGVVLGGTVSTATRKLVGDGTRQHEVFARSEQGSFWTYTQGSDVQAVKGAYGLDKNVLAMEPESGGVILAELTPPANGAFRFQLLGAPPGDPGLKFAKSR